MGESDSSCDEALGAQWSEEKVLARYLKPLLDHYDLKWRGRGWIYVDHQEENILAANKVVSDLSVALGVPSASIRARLTELKWLRDDRNILPNPNEVKRAELLLRSSGIRELDYLDRDDEFEEGGS
ncbi:hypothetical protein V0R50_08600 [Pseudomonas sp. 148P]|uniref:Uncharacterized protein n=1 Tax=Pseudomonas ulcerans TaxID=3115852 RepID=A0ABU7HP29_9PSED|nr:MULTISPECIES: hypothetical protein [unclassified Pseudomonas]MEE1920497.1 hypothetical protein [Pseudomonas sp. 147P]MEE1933279.1 hypothetical protein [Pseudomonas sp. 148P]